MAVSTRQHRRPEPRSGLIKKTAASLLISGPFFVAGGFGITESGLPGWAAGVLLIVGLLLATVALISVGRVFPPLTLVESEQLLVSRHPTMKPAFARMAVSIPFFAGAWWLFEFTLVPYVFPFAVFMVATYIFFKGTMRYLRNLHLTYTVTDRRVVQQYRFLWLNTKEIPLARIISISEVRNFFEIITGRGSIVVSSGIGERQTVRMEDISDPGPIAESIRQFFE
jgi:hypothetical protein